MKRLSQIVILALLFFFCASLPAWAEGEEGVALPSVNGSLRGAWWSGTRGLDDESGLLSFLTWLKTEWQPTEVSSFYLESWMRNDDSFGGGSVKGLVREAYADISLDDVDLRIGRQIIAWGRADRLNPTDNLTPRDLTILVPDDDDQRKGSLGIRSDFHVSDFTLTALWLLEFNVNKVAFPSVMSVEDSSPQGRWKQWAIRLERSGDVDFSVSFYDGFDLNPDIEPIGTSGSTILAKAVHHRIRVVGADFATAAGRWGLRGEGAYTFTEDRGGDDPLVKNSFFYGVVGVERSFLESLNVNFQYFFRHVTDYEDPEAITDESLKALAVQMAVINSEIESFSHGLTMRVGDKWFNETLEAEIAGVVTFERAGYLLKPKVTYAFNDNWKGLVGADIYGGDEASLFGLMKDNRSFYTELRYSF